MNKDQAYKLLDLASGASEDDIKKAYKRLAMKYHPDREGGDENKFKEAKEAYEVLLNKNRVNEQQFAQNSGDFQEVFDTIFRNFGFEFNQQQTPQRQNHHLHVNVQLELVETLTEQTKYVNVKRSGSQQTEFVKITIPAGALPGQKIRYTGLGDNKHSDLTPGDLYVTITFNMGDKRLLDNGDLFLSHTVSVMQACIGAKIVVKSIESTDLEVTLPAGTQSGTVLCLKNQGILVRGKRTDLRIAISVTIPKLDTDDAIKQHISDLQSNLKQHEEVKR